MIGKLVLCGLFALALAAPHAPTRKCVPKQHEVIILGKIAQAAGGQPMVLSFVGKSSMDYTNKKQAVHETVDVNGTPTNYSIIADYGKMKAYAVQSDAKRCTVSSLSHPMPELCDDTGTLLGSFELGGKMADMYELDFNMFGNAVRETLSVFRDTFTPVSAVIEQVYSGIPQMIAMQFGNMTVGIKDQKVFEIPSYCSGN